MIAERAHLLSVAEQDFELAEVAFPRVDGLGACEGGPMSIRSRRPGKTLEVRLYSTYVETVTRAA